MIDTHAHLYLASKDINDLLSKAISSGLSHVICVGINLETSLKALELSKKHPQISPTIGIHPGETQTINDLKEIEKWGILENFSVHSY